MKKTKKSRVDAVGVKLLQGFNDVYYLTVPYDKRQRVIPSSVECAYNSLYHTLEETQRMLRAL